MLASGPVKQGFDSTWGRILAFFSFASVLPILKPIRFFRFSDLVICGFLVWSDSVRTAVTVVIMYRFRAVPHVLYSSTTNNVLFTAGMWITADFRLYPPVITANQELVSPTGDHRYRGGTERAHPRGFRVL